MEESKLEDKYKIDRKRLNNYYERIENQSQSLEQIQIISNFLHHQGVALSDKNILTILRYFENKLNSTKTLIDFAFEWIRAHKIRLEYKKYLIRAQYPVGHLALAIDDCIYLFFLEYDKYIRYLLKEDISEYEISTLYHIFFSSFDTKDIDLHMSLDWYRCKVPTHFNGIKKIDTSIATIRSAFSLIIVKDYESVIYSRNEAFKKKDSEFQKRVSSNGLSNGITKFNEFRGSLIERMIKTYCITNIGLSSKEIEKAITQFLSTYLKFGSLYNYDEFKLDLIQSLAKCIFSGLTEEFKELYLLNEIELLISRVMDIFKDLNKFDSLDGLAWIEDLKPFLKIFLLDFVYHLIEENSIKISPQLMVKKQLQDKSKIKTYDFDLNYDLSLSVEEFRNKLEAHLKNSNLGSIEMRNIVRVKVQEFQVEKRKY